MIQINLGIALGILSILATLLIALISYIAFQIRQSNLSKRAFEEILEHIKESRLHTASFEEHKNKMQERTNNQQQDITEINAKTDLLIQSQNQQKIMIDYMKEIFSEIKTLIKENTTAISDLRSWLQEHKM